MRIDDEEFDDEEYEEFDDDEEDEQAPPVVLVELAKLVNPINLPSGKSCLCDICGQPLLFLLQVYAPLSDKESKSTFVHRTLFVFMCPSMSCLLQDQHEQPEKGYRSIKVFRCQLPYHNQFYSGESDKPLGTTGREILQEAST
ncbi:hypothetical protein L1987_62646 [Smallanthus sonchifolius]|uniref:Uncharacterized protein n=1 Tax=Smallanthus sonchifolius TaxID=185202 RepID=A0ACB9CB38_9ASTR|nr:hypothetical protein L1987_62646 [Smallanthus sonchifolius]